MKYGKFSLGYTKFEIPVFSGRRGCFWNSREILGYTNLAAQCCRGNSGNHRWGWKDSGTVLNLKSARTELCRTSGVRCQREALVGDWKGEAKWRKPGETAVPQGRGENVSKTGSNQQLLHIKERFKKKKIQPVKFHLIWQIDHWYQ